MCVCVCPTACVCVCVCVYVCVSVCVCVFPTDKCPSGEDTFIAAGDVHYYYHCQQGQDGNVKTRAILMK